MQPTDYLARILPAKVAHSLGEGLGIHTVADLIYHFPRRYIHGRMIFDPAQTVDGDSVMVRGQVVSSELSRMRQRKGYILRVTVRSGGIFINVAFFHPHGIARILTEGTEVLLDGTIQRRGRFFDMSPSELSYPPKWGAGHRRGTVRQTAPGHQDCRCIHSRYALCHFD